MNTIAEIADVLKKLKSAVIFTHMRPDGDTLGGALALSRALSFLNVKNEVVNEGEIPERFLFLAGAKNILRRPSFDAEGYLCVDSSDPSRLGELEKIFRAGVRKITVNLDHHVSNTRYCKYNFVRNRASNCENILELIAAMGVPLDKETGDLLMTGMVTDSGCFSHSDVNGDTFRAAATVAETGADVSKISYEVFRKKTKSGALLYTDAISRLRFFLDDRLAVAVVTAAMLEKYGLKQDATEGIVDFALNIDAVEVSVCLMEVKKGQYKASLRSKGRANVNRVAATFGGGGHVLASGCMLFGEVEEILDRLSYAVFQNLEDA